MNKFSEPQARHVLRQLLEGVKYLHDHGIVHRDLKLENILVMDVKTLSIKISDFGLANVIDEYCFLNTVCGTPSYGKPKEMIDQVVHCIVLDNPVHRLSSR
jgi:serine/threonine protein kinase